jgi:hypothetical protein
MPSTDWLLKLGIALLAIALGVLAYSIISSRGPSFHPLQELTTFQQEPRDAAGADSSTESPPGAPAAGTRRAAAGASRSSTMASEPGTPPNAAPATLPPTLAVRQPQAVRVPSGRRLVSAPAPRRADHYMPGNMTGWTAYDVTLQAPLLVRAAGQLTTSTDASGPDGVRDSNYERTVVRRRADPDRDERVLASAPYLSLIGRVCSGQVCSDPFLVGTRSVICPTDVEMTGQLQLWTNNYVRVNGTQTLNSYSQVSGGYSFYTESAPATACANRTAPAVLASDAATLAQSGMLDRPEFVISSSQSAWKPFFIPLGGPLLLHATGEMRPHADARPTGPDGIRVADPSRWSYPGSRDIALDGQNTLFDRRLPYQALIGRLCGTSTCGQPFLVGHEAAICPAAPFNDHLELWINHIISPPGLLAQTTLTLEALEMQTRRGEYHFTVSADAGRSCGSNQ